MSITPTKTRKAIWNASTNAKVNARFRASSAPLSIPRPPDELHRAHDRGQHGRRDEEHENPPKATSPGSNHSGLGKIPTATKISPETIVAAPTIRAWGLLNTIPRAGKEALPVVCTPSPNSAQSPPIKVKLLVPRSLASGPPPASLDERHYTRPRCHSTLGVASARRSAPRDRAPLIPLSREHANWELLGKRGRTKGI